MRLIEARSCAVYGGKTHRRQRQAPRVADCGWRAAHRYACGRWSAYRDCAL